MLPEITLRLLISILEWPAVLVGYKIYGIKNLRQENLKNHLKGDDHCSLVS